jgi:hypothetical protein
MFNAITHRLSAAHRNDDRAVSDIGAHTRLFLSDVRTPPAAVAFPPSNLLTQAENRMVSRIMRLRSRHHGFHLAPWSPPVTLSQLPVVQHGDWIFVPRR